VLYFCLIEEEEKERKKKRGKKKEKNHYGKGRFPWGWTRLAGCAVGHSS
jgi:hypothetical protein